MFNTVIFFLNQIIKKGFKYNKNIPKATFLLTDNNIPGVQRMAYFPAHTIFKVSNTMIFLWTDLSRLHRNCSYGDILLTLKSLISKLQSCGRLEISGSQSKTDLFLYSNHKNDVHLFHLMVIFTQPLSLKMMHRGLKMYNAPLV